MKFYIAGKITDFDPVECADRFAAAEMLLEKAGHTPLNPLKLVDQAEGRGYNAYLHDALRVLMLGGAEALYMLSNWTNSKGARIEHAIAIESGMPIFYEASELPIESDWPEVSRQV